MVVAALALPGATPLQGGLPILYEGKVIGAIGVSGDTPQEDEDIARVGAAAFKWAGMVKRIGWAAVAVVGAVIIATPTDAGVSAPAPEITASTWFNSPPKAIADLRSKVALVEFWTFGCYNCRNVEPHVKEWNRKYAERGLVVIGVHTPETAYERDVDNVRRYVHEHDLSYAVAIDGDSTTWERYGNHAWPAWYLIDRRGVIRHVRIGEGAYAKTEREIEALLAE